MNSISVFFLEAQEIGVFILISHEAYHENIKLNFIKFFENEARMRAFIIKNQFIIHDIDEKDGNPMLRSLRKLIKDYLAGKERSLFEAINDLHVLLNLNERFSTRFSSKVMREVLKLRFGETASYSDIANRIGSKAYRAIGSILKLNPLPLIIPCHRVIKKNGKIGGFMGETKSNWQIRLKESLLSIEGIIL